MPGSASHLYLADDISSFVRNFVNKSFNLILVFYLNAKCHHFVLLKIVKTNTHIQRMFPFTSEFKKMFHMQLAKPNLFSLTKVSPQSKGSPRQMD